MKEGEYVCSCDSWFFGRDLRATLWGVYLIMCCWSRKWKLIYYGRREYHRHYKYLIYSWRFRLMFCFSNRSMRFRSKSNYKSKSMYADQSKWRADSSSNQPLRIGISRSIFPSRPKIFNCKLIKGIVCSCSLNKSLATSSWQN